MKKIISTSEAPAAVGPYSQAVRVGSTIYCAGQIPLDPKSGQIVSGDDAGERTLPACNFRHLAERIPVREISRQDAANSTQDACAPQKSMSKDLLALFRKTGALLDGHFILRSGLHSRQYFQCALLLQDTEIAAKICGWLADKLRKFDCDTVISPALGGIIVGQEVGRSLSKRHIFVEKEDGGLLCV